MTLKISKQDDREILVFDRPNLLFVEGTDDAAFVEQLLPSVGDDNDWHVVAMGGKDTNWSALLGIALDSREFRAVGRSIGLVQDADNDASLAASRLQAVFVNNDRVPPASHGAVLDERELRVGFFVMPDGSSNGALEELLVRAISGERFALAQAYIEKVSDEIEPPKHPTKAQLQAYFSAQRELVKTIPAALRHPGVMPAAHLAYNEFGRFLANLAG